MSDWEDMLTSSDDEPINKLEEEEEEEIDEWELMVNDTFKAEREQALKLQNRNQTLTTNVNYVENITKMETHEIIKILKDIIKTLDVHSLTDISSFTNTQKNTLLKSTKKKNKNKKKLPKMKAGKFNDNVLNDMYYD
jgi:hypothetical protein